MAQVVRVRGEIQRKTRRPVAGRAVVPSADRHVACSVRRRGRGAVREPVLNVGMVITPAVGRQPRDRVVEVRHAVVTTRLCRHESHKGEVTDARGTKGVKVAALAGGTPTKCLRGQVSMATLSRVIRRVCGRTKRSQWWQQQRLRNDQ